MQWRKRASGGLNQSGLKYKLVNNKDIVPYAISSEYFII